MDAERNRLKRQGNWRARGGNAIAPNHMDNPLPSIADMARTARRAQHALAQRSTADKAAALRAAAAAIRADGPTILAANARDMAAASHLSPALRDRLALDAKRLAAMADAIEDIAALPDPVGEVYDVRHRPNGLRLERVRIPIGVIGMIYESRPNVTADAAALCLMSGNAVLLRGGREAAESNAAIHAAFIGGIKNAGFSADLVQRVASPDRALVGDMLGATGLIDLIIPRGGKALVARIAAEARVPTLAHLDGNNHIYVHAAANADMARAICINAKLHRPGICGAVETLLIDQNYPAANILIRALLDAGCEVRGDGAVQAMDARVVAADDADWHSEYLLPILAARQVTGLAEAIEHIAAFGSGHSEAILTDDDAAAAQFLNSVDSAIVFHNASTIFADGGEFGMGAEIGIATGRLHARGPVALEGLTTHKWRVLGTGQVRG